MYKRAVSLLTLGSCVIIAAVLCAKGVSGAWFREQPVSQLRIDLKMIEEKDRQKQKTWSYEEGLGIGLADSTVSEERVVEYTLLEQQDRYDFPDEEIEVLLRIVEAEAGSEDEEGRLLVANVILNRVRSELFPDSVSEVVFQNEGGAVQFTPAYSGSYYAVEVSDTTVRAVERALSGEDISGGALYFAARKYANKESMKWFDEKLEFLFQHGGHEFFR